MRDGVGEDFAQFGMDLCGVRRDDRVLGRLGFHIIDDSPWVRVRLASRGWIEIVRLWM